MKKIFLALVVFASISAVASEKNNSEACSDLSRFAESVMKLRQDGKPMREVYAVVAKHNNAYLLKMVEIAYAENVYHSPEIRTHAISQFGSTAFKSCIAAFAK